MNSFIKKALLGIGTVGTIIAPICVVVSCGTSAKKAIDTSTKDTSTKDISSQDKANEAQYKKFQELVQGFDFEAPKAFGFFSLPDNFPEAPENTHFEFNNNEIYNLKLDTNGNHVDYWSPAISNFMMIPHFKKATTVFKVKIVADKGYVLSKDAQFNITYNTELLSWDKDIDITKNAFVEQNDGPNKGKIYSSLEKVIATEGKDAATVIPDATKVFTEVGKDKNTYMDFADFNAFLNQTESNGFKPYKTLGASKSQNGSFIVTKDDKEYAYYEHLSSSNEKTHWTNLKGSGVKGSDVFIPGKTYEIDVDNADDGNLIPFNVKLLLRTDGTNLFVKPSANVTGGPGATMMMQLQAAKKGDDPTAESTVMASSGTPLALSNVLKSGFTPESLISNDENKFNYGSGSTIADATTVKIRLVSNDLTTYNNGKIGEPSLEEFNYGVSEIALPGAALTNPGFFEDQPTSVDETSLSITKDTFLNIKKLITCTNGSETEVDFHEYNKDIDIAKDLNLLVKHLDVPLFVTDTMTIDGQEFHAVSNRSNDVQADSIY